MTIKKSVQFCFLVILHKSNIMLGLTDIWYSLLNQTDLLFNVYYEIQIQEFCCHGNFIYFSEDRWKRGNVYQITTKCENFLSNIDPLTTSSSLTNKLRACLTLKKKRNKEVQRLCKIGMNELRHNWNKMLWVAEG